MSDDVQQLQIDLHNLIMASDRNNSDIARQLYIRQCLNAMVDDLTRCNASAINMIANHVRTIAPPQREEDEALEHERVVQLAARFGAN